MDEIAILRFERLIADHAGLQLRPREREALRGILAARMAALHTGDADEYYRLLQAETPTAESEWRQLMPRLTNKESYFFRDKGQMALLRERILPELIARNQARRTLRLWSAGCSTGEEPYSLAILVDELLPQGGISSGSKWEIVILGTDIDGQALEQARRGVYGSWSFRTVEPALQQRYFHRQEDGWHVAGVSRALVTFSRCNLVSDPFPSTAAGIHDMDLILCRNVFIYFEREAIAAVLLKFAQTLRDGGCLMTGHAEIQGQSVEPLQARMFPESMVYQRVGKASYAMGTPVGGEQRQAGTQAGYAATRSRPPISATNRDSPSAQQAAKVIAIPPLAPSTAKVEHVLAEAEAHYAVSEHQEWARTLPPTQEPAEENVLLRRARTHANLGRYEEAADCCRRLMEAFPFAPAPCELLAAIAGEQGRPDEAKRLLKQALYLAPASPSAYLELGAIYHSEGDTERARKMRVTALKLLQQMPPETVVGSGSGPTAREWILHLEQDLKTTLTHTPGKGA